MIVNELKRQITTYDAYHNCILISCLKYKTPP